MKSTRKIGGAAAIGAALLLGTVLSAPPAEASYIVTLTQVGANVVASGSGTIDLTGLSFFVTGLTGTEILPNYAVIVTGPVSGTATDAYTGITGPASFGSGGTAYPSSGSGDLVGVIGTDLLAVPAGYVSGNALSDTSTYDNQTFASLGVTPGTYVWTWGSGADDDSFTLDVKTTAVPEPSGLLVLLLPLGLVMLLGARQQRRANRDT